MSEEYTAKLYGLQVKIDRDRDNTLAASIEKDLLLKYNAVNLDYYNLCDRSKKNDESIIFDTLKFEDSNSLCNNELESNKRLLIRKK